MNETEIFQKMLKTEIFTNLYKTKFLFTIIEQDLNKYTKTLGITNHGRKYEFSILVKYNIKKEVSINYNLSEVKSFKNPSINTTNTITKILNSDLNLTKDKKNILIEILDLNMDISNVPIYYNDIIFDNFVFLTNPRTINKIFYSGFYSKFEEKKISEEEYINLFVNK